MDVRSGLLKRKIAQKSAKTFENARKRSKTSPQFRIPKTPGNCLRFANPAEADWRLEVGKLAGQYLGNIRRQNVGSPEQRGGNGIGMELNGMECKGTQ